VATKTKAAVAKASAKKEAPAKKVPATKKETAPKKATAPKKPVTEAPVRKARNGTERLGRPPQFAGMRLFPKNEDNPRREGSYGYKSYEIIRKNPGITYEDFLKKGGRSKDFSYDFSPDLVRAEA